jgi:DNA modification methylase
VPVAPSGKGNMEVFKCAHTDVKSVSELLLIQNPKNNNTHSKEQIARLAKIIDFQGQRSPIVISKRSGFIVKGHGRLMALDKLKWQSAAVDFQDYKTEAEEYADMTADNEIARWAEFNESKFLEDIKTIDLGDLELLGLKDIPEILIDKEPLCDEDEVPDHVEPKTKLGDVYKLGEHRLMCGDSTSIDSVEKLMNGQKADITFTSPPYNVPKQGFQAAKYNSGFESQTDEEYNQFLYDFTSICLEKSTYVFVNNQLLANNRFSLIEYQYKFKEFLKDILIWNKKICPPNICKGAFNTKFEYVFIFSKDNRTRGFPCKWQGQYPNVIETESNSGNEFANVHKAGFPLAFPLWIIEKMDFAKSVLDPFGGTGTTLIACEKTNRKCFMMELDPHYCDVIVARWEKYTGKQAELING